MKNHQKILVLVLVFAILMIWAVGTVHLIEFVEGPLRFTGLAIIVVAFLLFALTNSTKLVFTDDAIEMHSIPAGKTIVPYTSIKSVEYIETKITTGNGLKTKVRHIKFNLDDGKSYKFSETQIRYKKCVKNLIDAYDNCKLPSSAIKKTTMEALLNSVGE